MHLVGFIIKKFVTMHGHMNVKKRVSFGCNVTEVSVMTTKPNFRKEMDLLTLDALDKMGMYTLV